MNRSTARIVLSFVGLVSLLSLPAAAQAYGPYDGWYGPWGGCGYNRYYSTTYNDVQPYYSVYPPVYYSPYVSMRPYGASPFAWPAGMSPVTTATRGYAMTAAPKPMMIVNPYVEGAAAEPGPALPEQGRVKLPAKASPVKIENPFVASVGR